MKTKQKIRTVYAAAILLVLIIIGYNLWSYYAGFCTVETLLTFSLPAKLLLAGIAAASLLLFSYKAKNRQRQSHGTCVCGAVLRDQWSYCPVCGHQRKNQLND